MEYKIQYNKKIIFLTALFLALIVLFLVIGLNVRNWEYALSRRIPVVIAMILTGGSIAFSSVIFQTITNNRILTPSVLGLDAFYLFIQTVIVFVFGSSTLATLGESFNFSFSVALMGSFSLLLFKVLFRKEGHNIFYLLLLGLVFGTFFSSLASFMQVLIDPNEFLIVQGKMFASFNNINTEILGLAIAVTMFSLFFTYKELPSLDVLSLGRENAINLGVDYDKVVKKMLFIICILVSVSTALVGPITFLGLLVVNLAREFLQTFRHKHLIIGSMLISTIALIGGQLITERILNFSTPVSVIINFIGGVYFMYLLLKEAKL